MKKRYIFGMGIIVFFIALYVFATVPFRSERGFICENTGSTKGYTEWMIGIKTGHWYRRSALEDFIQENYPDKLQHRWTSYAGDEKDLLGTVITRSHGMPGAILEYSAFVDDWMQESQPDDIYALYELLSSDMDEETKRQRIEKIVDGYLGLHDQQGTSPPAPTGSNINSPG